MSLITYIPLRPESTSTPSPNSLADFRLTDRIGGHSDPTKTPYGPPWLYLTTGAAGTTDVFYGSMSIKGAAAFVAAWAGTTSASGVVNVAVLSRITISVNNATFVEAAHASNEATGGADSLSARSTISQFSLNAAFASPPRLATEAWSVEAVWGPYTRTDNTVWATPILYLPTYTLAADYGFTDIGRITNGTVYATAYTGAANTASAFDLSVKNGGKMEVLGSNSVFTYPAPRVFTTYSSGWTVNFAEVPMSYYCGVVSTGYMYPFDNTEFIPNKVNAGDVDQPQFGIESDTSMYKDVGDPLFQHVRFLTHCVGTLDDHSLTDIIANAPTTGLGPASLKSGGRYDGMALTMAPPSSPTQVSYATFTGFYTGLFEYDCTVSFRVKVVVAPTGYCPLFCSKGASGNVDFVLGLAGSLSLLVWSSSTSGSWDVFNGVACGGTLMPNVWHQVTMIRSGSYFSVYLDGVQGTPFTVSTMTGGSEPSGFNSLSINANADFDELYVSHVAEYNDNFAPAPWAVTENTDALFAFNDGAGATTLNSSANSGATIGALVGAARIAANAYSGTGCLELTYGEPRIFIDQTGNMDNIFDGHYSVELVFNYQGHSGTFAPLFVNYCEITGAPDLILGFTTDNVLRIWASSCGTTFNVFNGVSTGVTIPTNTWCYLNFTGGDGTHYVSLNGGKGTILTADHLVGGAPSIDLSTSGCTISYEEIRITAATRTTDSIGALTQRFSDAGVVQVLNIVYYDPKNTLFPPTTIVATGENVNQTTVYI